MHRQGRGAAEAAAARNEKINGRETLRNQLLTESASEKDPDARRYGIRRLVSNGHETLRNQKLRIFLCRGLCRGAGSPYGSGAGAAHVL